MTRKPALVAVAASGRASSPAPQMMSRGGGSSTSTNTWRAPTSTTLEVPTPSWARAVVAIVRLSAGSPVEPVTVPSSSRIREAPAAGPVITVAAARFAREARAAGAAGLLITDLPVGADEAVEAALGSAGLPLVRLVAPTTPAARQKLIAARSRGFLYLVSRLGVTGESGGVPAALGPQVAALRAVTQLPIAVGFGIATAEQAVAVARLADGVVIGSAVVSRMARGGAAAALEWLRTVRAALDARG